MRATLFSIIASFLAFGCDGSPQVAHRFFREPATALPRDAAIPETDAPRPDPEDAETLDPNAIHFRFTTSSDDESFYRMPWPSDARRTPAGTPELSDFPVTSAFIESTIAEIENYVHGFATMPVVYFGLDASLPEGVILPSGVASRETTSPIQFLDLSEEGCGRAVPFDAFFAAEPSELVDANVLRINNSLGTVLEPARPYGVIVLRALGADVGMHTNRPIDFDAALADTEGTTPLGSSLAPLRRCMASLGRSLDDIALATVFTTQDPTAELRVLRNYVTNPGLVPTSPVTDWQRNDGWSRHRLDITTYTGTVSMPVFQDGIPPYEATGGRLIFASDGTPEIQRWEPVEIAVAYRQGSFGAAPRPILVFMDGTGWAPWNHVSDNWITQAMDLGFVVMSFMPQFHGERAGVNPAGADLFSFNILNPSAVRANFRQQAVETSFFVRLIREQIDGLAGLPELLPDQIVYGGHSQGAMCGSFVAAVEDQFKSYVFSGLSSFLTLTVLHRKDLLDFEQVVRTVMGLLNPLDRHHPALQLLQMGAEVTDPHNYAHLWRGSSQNPDGNHVFVSNGFGDETTTPEGMAQLTMSGDIPPIEPAGWDFNPDSIWPGTTLPVPIQGNTASYSERPLTIATYMDPTEGHGTIYRESFPRNLAVEFWRSSLAGVPRLYTSHEYTCGDGFDGDEDGVIDCEDSDCVSTPPCVEGACDNALDEDGNGLIDCLDPVCFGRAACIETVCDDGLDDEVDTLLDCSDPDCADDYPCRETICDDRLDDDGDGDIDCEDSQCDGSRACYESSCTDRRDNDRNGLRDCEDPQCRTSVACPETACSDLTDNNDNMLSDCADPGCALTMACFFVREAACNDGDDDVDGAADCDDSDCALDPMCSSVTCADGDLGTRTGVPVFIGVLDGAGNEFPAADCTSLGTGIDSPDVALRWTAPTSGTFSISTYGSTANTTLAVYDASCNLENELACGDDDGPVATSRVNLTVVQGQTVTIVISGREDTDIGAVRLHIYPRP